MHPELTGDLAFLRKLWSTIQGRADRASAPSLVYREAELPLRIVRDLFAGADPAVILRDLLQITHLGQVLEHPDQAGLHPVLGQRRKGHAHHQPAAVGPLAHGLEPVGNGQRGRFAHLRRTRL